MKELSIEEKAKAYDGLIERLKDLKFAYRFSTLCDTIEEKFPELEESEDERIRKELIGFCNSCATGQTSILVKDSSQWKRWIAWLEKRCETFTRKDVDDAYLRGITDTKNEIEKQYEETYQIRKDIASFIFNYRGDIKDRSKWMDYLGIKVSFAEKQVEQKSADKTEVEHLIPQKGMYYTCIKDYYSSNNTHLYVKGKVYKSFFNGYIDDESHFGLSWTNSCTEKYFEPTKDEDWIVCEHDNVIGKPMQYKEFKKKITQKFIENLKAKGITPSLRLWTIQDAKDGDALCYKDEISLYKHNIKNCTKQEITFGGFVYHCCYDGKRFITDSFYSLTEQDKIDIHPATKEQRDTLFAKMKEAGYEWDADKKELRKLEEEVNGEDYGIDSLWHAQNILERTLGKVEGYQTDDGILDHKCAITAIKKLYAQKHARWSKEDEKKLLEIKCLIGNYRSGNDEYELCSWIDKFKDRVQSQPKQEWSEEDEVRFESCIKRLQTSDGYDTINVKWLKDLKERVGKFYDGYKVGFFVAKNNQWKPSREQMKVIGHICDGNYNVDLDILDSIYRDFKKLKEE